ncbi:glutamate racemase [Halothece sp. PCC 7418]|uniref:glutamate racemase n=1 Tax=Halothece sp. (strain PCC 7418) TaxID=65093 RepID=UPI0002A062E5|nr:glutamate racemase [Halothece sp. PCC 7418]AFZ45512.1 glutamate racemase [Halothece sp. PCC 7418]
MNLLQGINLFHHQPSQSPIRPQHPIGVFDSGLGGLTVLRELYRQLPQESLLYFADTARLPYGSRSHEEIVQFCREILHWMTAQGVKMVIMACNTSSALALETVRSEFNIPILGVILPGARAAVSVGRRIGVIATPATATSNAYRQAILEVDHRAKVWQVSCPEFVPLIEQNRLNDPYVREVAQTYLAPLQEKQIDTLIYGCTHYPYLAPVLGEILPSNVQFIDPAQHVVTATEQELELMGLTNLDAPVPTRFCVSGDPDQFADRARHWLGCTPLVEQIQLPTLAHSYREMSISLE